MSVTSSKDPVKTIIDLLDNAAAADWDQGGSVPDRIDRSEAHEPSEKLRDSRLNDISLYIFSPADADRRRFSAAGDAEYTEIVQVDIFAQGSSTANHYAADVIDILDDYTIDNGDQTAWVDIWPESVDDQTAHGFMATSFTPIAVQVRLRRHADA